MTSSSSLCSGSRRNMSDWPELSILWESCFNHDPEGVSRLAGAPLSLLNERVVTDTMLADGFQVRLSNHHHDGELEGDLVPDQIIAGLGSMIELGQLEDALAMARRMHEAHPSVDRLTIAYAFCTIPHDPVRARQLLEQLRVTTPSAVDILTASLASCALFEGNDVAAVQLMTGLDHGKSSTVNAWLWDPAEALNGHAVGRLLSVSEWRERLERVSVVQQAGTTPSSRS